jgi:hypothetical protein
VRRRSNIGVTSGELTDTEGAATILNVTVHWLERDRITKRRIPFVKLDDRMVRYVTRDLYEIVRALPRIGGEQQKTRRRKKRA